MDMTVQQVDLYMSALEKEMARQNKMFTVLSRGAQAAQKDYKELLAVFEKMLKS